MIEVLVIHTINFAHAVVLFDACVVDGQELAKVVFLLNDDIPVCSSPTRSHVIVIENKIVP